jgi:hypothetical protein
MNVFKVPLGRFRGKEPGKIKVLNPKTNSGINHEKDRYNFTDRR